MKKAKTIVNFILDESGSMEEIKDSVINGFNEYVQGLKKEKNGFFFTLTKFDSMGIRMPYSLVDIKKVEKLDKKTYQPGQMTPLYDAVVETIEKVAERIKPDQKSVVVIMTDGYENASTKHDEVCLRKLVEELQSKGNWTFVYLGANQDSWAVASKFGIHTGNIMNWRSTADGTTFAFNCMAVSTSNFSKGKTLSTDSFFENEDDS